MIEVDSAERACRVLVEGYAKTLRGDGRLDWSDIDEAYIAACCALGVQIGKSEHAARGAEPRSTLDIQKLRELASWYCEFADRAGSRDISQSRHRMAEDLEREACLLEQTQAL